MISNLSSIIRSSMSYWQVLLQLRAAKYMVIPLFWALNILCGLRPLHGRFMMMHSGDRNGGGFLL